ncbi:LamG domain-containing protein [Candidatus Pacearchaeota archaeon]|nr:LamG domain-containing protein [Candidatus Pacearchaeota archaeon]
MRKWYTNPYLGVPLTKEHNLAQGLVACWLLNEGGGGQVYDLSGYDNHGTLTNMDAKTDWVPGKFGKALDFDGINDCIVVSANYKKYTPYYISFWIKPRDITTNRYIFDTNQINDRGTVILGYQDGFFNFVGDGGYPTGVPADTQFPATQDVWQHIVMGTNGTKVYAYKNGIKVVEEIADWAVNAIATTSYYIGTIGNQTTFFNGRFSNILIYNRTLTAQEVQQLYLEPFAMFDYPSVAEYFVPAVGVIAPTSVLYGPLFGPLAGPV